MAHPYKAHAAAKVAKDRVGHVMKSGGYARGGKVNINIVVPKGDAPAGPAGAAGPPPMAVPAPPMPMPPPGPPMPGGPMGGPPPPMGGPPMMRKRGGRVKLPTAGADTGVARLQRAGKKK